jgi:hypothetical protein
MRLSCGTGERMRSTSEGEDMGVKGKEGCKMWQRLGRPLEARASIG